MTTEITIQVPDALGQQLERFHECLPEILERGLQQVLAEKPDDFQEENVIMELLTSQPTPQQVLGIRPTPEFQARVSELLQRNKGRSRDHGGAGMAWTTDC